MNEVIDKKNAKIVSRIVFAMMVLSTVLMVIASVGWFVFDITEGPLVLLGRIGSFMVIPILAFSFGMVYGDYTSK